MESEEIRDARHCWGPACINAARPHSKYCSDLCGKELAKRFGDLEFFCGLACGVAVEALWHCCRRLQHYLPERLALWSQEESIVYKNRQAILDDMKLREEVSDECLCKIRRSFDQTLCTFDGFLCCCPCCVLYAVYQEIRCKIASLAERSHELRRLIDHVHGVEADCDQEVGAKLQYDHEIGTHREKV